MRLYAAPHNQYNQFIFVLWRRCWQHLTRHTCVCSTIYECLRMWKGQLEWFIAWRDSYVLAYINVCLGLKVHFTWQKTSMNVICNLYDEAEGTDEWIKSKSNVKIEIINSHQFFFIFGLEIRINIIQIQREHTIQYNKNINNNRPYLFQLMDLSGFLGTVHAAHLLVLRSRLLFCWCCNLDIEMKNQWELDFWYIHMGNWTGSNISRFCLMINFELPQFEIKFQSGEFQSSVLDYMMRQIGVLKNLFFFRLLVVLNAWKRTWKMSRDPTMS